MRKDTIEVNTSRLLYILCENEAGIFFTDMLI